MLKKCQFYLKETDIGKNRAICSSKNLSELNSYVPVFAKSQYLKLEDCTKYNVINFKLFFLFLYFFDEKRW